MKSQTATSNAPSIGRKRRMNDEDEDEQEAGSSRKRRGQLERQDTSSSELGELGVKEVKGSEVDPAVKQVTRGVKEVELEDKKEESRTDDGKSVTEEESKAIGDGDSSATAPLDPTHAAPTQNDDDPSQGTTVTDDKVDKVPAGQSEAIAEALLSNDPPEVDAPTSTDRKAASSQDEEKEISDTTPGVESDEVGDTRESVESSPER